ncbi:Uma2 family endonuclease [Leptolyngbya sp. BC1307]|uniref:Uma2 family endonuclease n=1 Tax=Leptolyngbya sp. BC1307 TaxID=2029589 RepID=UPI000EFD7EAC|nr:Uma2 family endonuclease [Leptolyngbya sp. BC1307]
MVQQLPKTDIVYPDGDGQPMSDNTLQFQWIVNIKENLEAIYANDPNVFVAGDLLWYPVEGSNSIRQAPDAMIAFGRPKGDRSSYMQWKEGDIAPQVVFEILSPGNRGGELAKKFQFYQRYGVQEYYVYDPDDVELIGWQRAGQYLEVIEDVNGWTSPLLKVRFVVQPDTLEIYRPDGEPFLSLTDTRRERDAAQQERDAAQQERDAAQQERNIAQAKAERLAARLRELGIDPTEA